MLWLALDLPLLPLRALGLAPHEPAAVLDAAQQVHALTPAAAALGVQQGMPGRTAQAVAPGVRLWARQPAAEQEMLQNLGTWALSYSSKVSLSPPRQLVLEIGASLRLFGGLVALLEQIRQAAQAQEQLIQLGVAPTVRGAELLARADLQALDTAALQAALEPLPLDWLDWPESVRRKLQAVGVRQIGPCLRLPRAGFGKRYGAERRLELDQVLGLAPEVRVWHAPPACFQRQAELYDETDRIDILRPGFARLFAELAADLQGRDCGLNHIHIRLRHPRVRASEIRLGLQQVDRDPERWLRLLDTHLDRHPLPAPVRGIGVQVDHFVPLAGGQRSLLPEPGRRARHALLELLAARLGPAALYRVQTVDDHRPELAWQRSDPLPVASRTTAAEPTPCPGLRPLWLLESPRPVAVSTLHLLSAAERIESGWWDGRPCRRDYYRARDDAGCRLWVFREYLQGVEPPRWFVHGFFA